MAKWIEICGLWPNRDGKGLSGKRSGLEEEEIEKLCETMVPGSQVVVRANKYYEEGTRKPEYIMWLIPPEEEQLSRTKSERVPREEEIPF
jgi:hypothetical protein